MLTEAVGLGIIYELDTVLSSSKAGSKLEPYHRHLPQVNDKHSSMMDLPPALLLDQAAQWRTLLACTHTDRSWSSPPPSPSLALLAA